MPKAVIGYDVDRDEYWISAGGMVVRLPGQMSGDLNRTFPAAVWGPAPAAAVLGLPDA